MSCETQKGAHTSVGLVSAEQRGAVAKMVGNVPFPDTVRFSPGNKEWENITLLCAECALLVGGGLRADWEGCVSWPLPGGAGVVCRSGPLCGGGTWLHSVHLSPPCLPNPSTLPSLCPGFLTGIPESRTEFFPTCPLCGTITHESCFSDPKEEDIQMLL